MRKISELWSRPRLRAVWSVCRTVYDELLRTRVFVEAAAMAFYFLLSLIPLLFVASAILGYLPIPDLFGQLLEMMASFVPPDAMAMVEKILASVLQPHRGGVLSFGILSYLWTASSGFSAAITSLDISYDTVRQRSWWRNRVQALLLTFTTGAFSLVALLSVIAGPHFGHFLVHFFHVPHQFAYIWPLIRRTTMFVTIVLAVEVLYYLGPNIKHSFRSTLPGAILAVFGFFTGSAALDLYFGHFSNYNKAYGSLGAVIILMLWFYVIAVCTLVGAELNAELNKRRRLRLEGLRARALDRPIPGVPAA